MSLEHRTVIGGVQIERSGNASILLKLIVADGAEEFSEKNHRFMIEKGQAIVPKIQDMNTILAAKGLAPIGTKAGIVIRDTLTACWTAMDA